MASHATLRGSIGKILLLERTLYYQIRGVHAEMASQRKRRDEDLDSEFEYVAEKRRKTWRDDPLASGPKPTSSGHHSATIPSKQLVSQEQDKEEWRSRRFHLLSMDAYSRHKALVNQYLLSCGRGIEHFQRPTENDRNDYTVLAEQHKFLWNPDDDLSTWEKRLAKTYYDRLFKEYAISDLSRFKENKIALRWRTEKEVVEGKGQFVCANKHCSEREDLQSWEVNFAYLEQGEKKNALVKLRLCVECSVKLNYHHKRKLWKKDKSKKSKKTRKSKHKHEHKHKHKHNKHKKKRYHCEKGATPESEGSSSSNESPDDGTAGSSAHVGAEASAIWSKPAEAFLEKSKEEEYDEYFKDMLL